MRNLQVQSIFRTIGSISLAAMDITMDLPQSVVYWRSHIIVDTQISLTVYASVGLGKGDRV
jgi:hypothetical protein